MPWLARARPVAAAWPPALRGLRKLRRVRFEGACVPVPKAACVAVRGLRHPKIKLGLRRQIVGATAVPFPQ